MSDKGNKPAGTPQRQQPAPQPAKPLEGQRPLGEGHQRNSQRPFGDTAIANDKSDGGSNNTGPRGRGE